MKVVAVRFTPASLRQMISDTNYLVMDSYYWKNITHFVFHALYYDYSGVITMSPDKETVLNDPRTYLPWLKDLKTYWPHIKIVWALPPLPEDMFLSIPWAFKNFGRIIYEYDVEAVEINLLNVLSVNTELEMTALGIEMEIFDIDFWVVLPSPAKGLDITSIVPNLKYVTINAFGFFNDLLLENEFANSVIGFNISWDVYSKFGIKPEQVLIGLETTGVEIAGQTTRIIPYHDIQHQKQSMILHLNYACGTSHLANPKKKIYFDDPFIIARKLMLCDTHGFSGVLVSDLVDDLPRNSIGGVWSTIVTHNNINNQLLHK